MSKSISVVSTLVTRFCVRFTYKHMLFFLFVFYFVLICLWIIATHYGDIGSSNHAPLRINAYPKDALSEAVHVAVNDLPSHELHTMYSVGCDSLVMWQLMQSVTLDFSWYNVNQTGHLTRIVSGCNNAANSIRAMSRSSIPLKADLHFLDDKELVRQCLDSYNASTPHSNASQDSQHHIFSLQWNWDQRFHIIFVPSFDDIKEDYGHVFGSNIKRYPQLNRILALYIIYHCTDYKQMPQDYMMMLDPDFAFLKALDVEGLQRNHQLALHKPVAGKYGLGDKWVKWLRHAGHKVDITSSMSSQYFEAGVPYILHNQDWYNVIPEWISWMSFAYERYNGIESDMYAYMIASYQLSIKHTLVEELMSTCMKSMDQNVHPLDGNTLFVHYCSSYKVDLSSFKELASKIGDPVYTFNKHWTKARRNRDTKEQQLWMIDCESPVLIEIPTINMFESYNRRGEAAYRKAYKQYRVVRTIVPLFNSALIAFKQKYCDNKATINTDRKIITHEATSQNGDILFHTVEDL